ncbi:MAG: HAMP domain-containing sensor histidine kinase [Fibrobacteria bacterium]
MNFLKLIVLMACPFWVFDLTLRVLQKNPPVWVADSMAVALILIGFGMFVKFLRGEKPTVEDSGHIGKPQARTENPNPGNPPENDAWERTLPGLFHEIRNYSSTLRGNTQLLRRHSLSSSMLEPLGRLERTTDKIEYLAKEILEVSSLTQLTHTGSFEIQELIERCILDHFSEDRGLFKLKIANDIPPVEADFLKLERVFLNLFRNAREAGANRILVRVAASPEKVRISVEDDGEGCSAEQVGKLFRPLFTTKKAKGGTGLGLYMVKAIMESHGGNIHAVPKNDSSGNGSGMVFTLELPMTQRRAGFMLRKNSFGISSVEKAI